MYWLTVSRPRGKPLAHRPVASDDPGRSIVRPLRTRWAIVLSALTVPVTPAAPVSATGFSAVRGPPATASAHVAQVAPRAAPAGVLWEADPNRGTSVFEGLERAPGTITV